MRCASVPTCEVRSPKGHEPEALRASRELARAGFELRASRPRIRCPFSLLPPSPLVSPAGAFRIRESECESEFRIRAPCVRPPRGSGDQTFREVSASERWEAACIVRPGMTKTRAVCRAHSHSTFEVRSSKPEARTSKHDAYAVCMHAGEAKPFQPAGTNAMQRNECVQPESRLARELTESAPGPGRLAHTVVRRIGLGQGWTD